MAIVRNNLVAEGKVLEELTKYLAALKDECTKGSQSIQRIEKSINDNSDSPELLGHLNNMRILSKKNLAEYLNLLMAVEAMLKQKPITQEQQASLNKNLDSSEFSASTKQFITSYTKNFTETRQIKAKEAEINERAKAFFFEDRAQAFFAKAKGDALSVMPVTTSEQPEAKVNRSSTPKRK